MTAHLRDPHIKTGPRQKRAQADAFGRKPEPSIGEATVQQNHRYAMNAAVIGKAKTRDRQLDAWFRREVQIGLDAANAGDVVAAEDVEAEAVAWRAETRRRMVGANS